MDCSSKNVAEVRAGAAVEAQEQEKHRDNLETAQNPFQICANTDLITGLGEDVVLAEVVTRLCRLPRNERPLLRMLNRSWNRAMTESFPSYHKRLRSNSPNILSNALILFHLKQTQARARAPGQEALYRFVRLWLLTPFDNNGNISQGASTERLPVQPFPEIQKRNFPKFVCDNHRVFSLTPSVVTDESNAPQEIYNVWMHDIIEDFNIHWKRLPPLPKLGNCVYAFSSSDNSSYIWQRRFSDSSEAEGWKLCYSNCEWHWEYVNVNTRPPRNLNFDIMSEKLPLYVEIGFTSGVKMLYRRCPIAEFTLNRSDFKTYIFMVPDDTISGIGASNLCFITIEGSKIFIVKVGLDVERTRILEDREWNDFLEYWDHQMRNRGVYEQPNRWEVHSQERSAIKVFWGAHPWTTGRELNFSDEAQCDVINKHSIIKLARKGPIYGYSYLGTKSPIMI